MSKGNRVNVEKLNREKRNRDSSVEELDLLQQKMDKGEMSVEEFFRLNDEILAKIKGNYAAEFKKAFPTCCNVDWDDPELTDIVFASPLALVWNETPETIIWIKSNRGDVTECYDARDLLQYIAEKILCCEKIPYLDCKSLQGMADDEELQDIMSPVLRAPITAGLWRQVVQVGSVGPAEVMKHLSEFFPIKRALVLNNFALPERKPELCRKVLADHTLSVYWNEYMASLQTYRFLEREKEFEMSWAMHENLISLGKRLLGQVAQQLRNDQLARPASRRPFKNARKDKVEKKDREIIVID